MGDRARRGAQLGVAPVTVVRTLRALIAIVFEGYERAGGGAFDGGASAFGHQRP
jgi:hypothetical protein